MHLRDKTINVFSLSVKHKAPKGILIALTIITDRVAK